MLLAAGDGLRHAGGDDGTGHGALRLERGAPRRWRRLQRPLAEHDGVDGTGAKWLSLRHGRPILR